MTTNTLLLNAPFIALQNASSVSVVFDFNASLNDTLPVSPISLSVDLMRMEKCGLLMDVICVLFLLSLPLRLSSVSVVFDFNASLNDVAPVFPIQQTVDLMKIKELIADGCHLCVVSFVLTPQTELSECCV